MPRNPRFRVLAELDGRGRFTDCTVVVHRGALVVSVRPLRRRRTYELPLSEVAILIYQRIAKAESAEKKAAAKAKRTAAGWRLLRGGGRG